MKSILTLLTLLLNCALLQADTPDKEKKADSKKTALLEVPAPVVKKGEVTIAGEKVAYQVTTSKTVLKNDEGEPTASIFSTSYVRTDSASEKPRPVMFAFNGGPGSSSVWLHLGILGPKRVDMNGDGTIFPKPPVTVIDNEFSLLDKTDLVFIDPVSTGYSRAEGETEDSDFHGIESDIDSVGEFIRIWVTKNKRWASPKYLCGESYGGIRAAGLSEHLQSRYGMTLNGTILLSAILDYRTILPAEGSHLSYQVFLPAFATTALHHGKIQGERKDIMRKARSFAYGGYTAALLKGTELPSGEHAEVAARLSELTGVADSIWIANDLRLSPTQFRAELLRSEGKVIGRFDSRVAWATADQASDYASHDPSFSLALQAFSTAMLGYLGNDLGWNDEEHYEILTSVSPWDYGAANRIVNLSSRLSSAMRENPALRVLVMGAYTDLATPPENIEYSIRQSLDLTPENRKNFTFTYYDAGHMFYLNPPDLSQAREDLVRFLNEES